MKAILLAAGFGSRLGEMTIDTPKCLAKVGQETMLDHWLFKLKRLGVERFFINTHYLADKVKEFVSGHPLKNDITLLHEPNLLGTGRTILRNIELLEDEVCFIVHVDNYCLDPLDRFLSAHMNRPVNTVLSMLTFTTNAPEKCGIVEVDADKRLIFFHEKKENPPSDQANGAVYIVSRPFFEVLKSLEPEPTDLSCDIIPALIGNIFCHHTDLYFEDIGTSSSLRKANEFLARDFLDASAMRVNPKPPVSVNENFKLLL